MIIDCLADLHGEEPELEGGDLLIIAGDLTTSDTPKQYERFFSWLSLQDHYRKKIVIAGNHDNEMVRISAQKILDPINSNYEWFEYLCDSGTEFEGLKIWGSPWTPLFSGVNSRCKAFMDSEGYLEKKFNLIPDNLDILITHGPMHQILDSNIDGYACGSTSLRQHINRVKPRFHVFGHIHEQGGNQLMYKREGANTWCVNCSYVDENYKPINNYVRIEL